MAGSRWEETPLPQMRGVTPPSVEYMCRYKLYETSGVMRTPAWGSGGSGEARGDGHLGL